MTILIAALALLAPPQAARPAPVTEAQDASCLAIFSVIANRPEMKDQAMLGALYFTGKLLGRNPAIDLKAVMTSAASILLDKPRLEAEGNRCGAEMVVTGGYMQAVGGALVSGE